MNNWCCEPFTNIYVENIDGGRVAPCCIALTDKRNQYFSLQQQPHLQEIRKSFIQGKKHQACRDCWQAEEQGLTSRRLQCGQESSSTDVFIRNVEINVNNRCNLACRICTPRYSTAWHNEARQLQLEIPKPCTNDLWHELDLRFVEWINFNGGEPLLSNDHVEMLEKIPDKSRCSVYYNTNGTIRASAKVIDLWSQFKHVKLAFSIDDIGDDFEYQRYGADWKQVEQNLLWYIENAPHNTMFAINRTISLYNNHRLQHLEDWYKKYFATNRYGDVTDFVDQLAVGHASLDSKEFEEFNAKLDRIRIKNVN